MKYFYSAIAKAPKYKKHIDGFISIDFNIASEKDLRLLKSVLHTKHKIPDYISYRAISFINLIPQDSIKTMTDSTNEDNQLTKIITSHLCRNQYETFTELSEISSIDNEHYWRAFNINGDDYALMLKALVSDVISFMAQTKENQND